MVVSIVGILKAGGVYCPIDPAYPPERIDFMVRDMGARLVLTHRHLITDLPGGVALVHIDDPESQIAATSDESVLYKTAPESPAALIYTSGSTGTPKGTLIPHRAVVRSIRNTNYLRVTAADRVGQAMSPSFDVCILEVWSALANGAALIGLPRETILAPAEMERTLRAERLSVLWIPTAYLHQIGRDTPSLLGGVRVVLFGGERAESEPLRRILQHGPPGELINCYGPAEGGIIASFHRIAIEDCVGTIPIGRPVKNVRMYVVDGQMRPAPIGVPGEIWIGGEIGSGYRNRSELNREKFVADTFSGLSGAKLYRSGDLGRLNGSGEFEFLGRADQQVKLRGYRIELSEVQMAVGSHPDVRQAIATIREDQPGTRRLVVYVTLRRDLTGAQTVLREHAAGKLPHYMVPAAIIPMESIPLTPNGKIDLRLLSVSGSPVQEAAYDKPATELEKAMAGIWKELLGLDRVASNDNFFSVGGDSLTGMRLIVAIRDYFGIDLPLRCLFDAADLSSFCEELHSYEQQPGQLEKLARIIEEVQNTSEEEVTALER
jgi:amino acid adenylation domain-containing protein